MRSVGAEVDVNDESSVAKFFDLIPSLPEHPRVRYATLLIISRYTEWINLRPQYIQFTLQYISSGFESSDSEVCAAAGQALKYLCQDCKQVRRFFFRTLFLVLTMVFVQHLVDFLPTLHTFLNTTGTKLVQDDRREVYTAIAYVISAMPMDRAAHSLRAFSADILAQVHALVGLTTPPSKEDIRKVCGMMSMCFMVASF
jgi:transportin-3